MKHTGYVASQKPRPPSQRKPEDTQPRWRHMVGKNRKYKTDAEWYQKFKPTQYKKWKKYMEERRDAKSNLLKILKDDPQEEFKKPLKHYRRSGKVYYEKDVVAEMMEISVREFDNFTKSGILPKAAAEGYTSSQIFFLMKAVKLFHIDKEEGDVGRAKQFLEEFWQESMNTYYVEGGQERWEKS